MTEIDEPEEILEPLTGHPPRRDRRSSRRRRHIIRRIAETEKGIRVVDLAHAAQRDIAAECGEAMGIKNIVGLIGRMIRDRDLPVGWLRGSANLGRPRKRAAELATRDDEIVRLYEAGESMRDIAPCYGIGELQVRRVLKKRGVGAFNSGPSPSPPEPASPPETAPAAPEQATPRSWASVRRRKKILRTLAREHKPIRAAELAKLGHQQFGQDSITLGATQALNYAMVKQREIPAGHLKLTGGFSRPPRVMSAGARRPRDEQIIAAYREGRALKDIGREFGLTASYVWKVLKRHGTFIPRPQLTESELPPVSSAPKDAAAVRVLSWALAYKDQLPPDIVRILLEAFGN